MLIERYKHISFDLDGTLVHTVPEYRHALVSRVVQQLGSISSPRDIDRFWFEPNRDGTIKSRFGLEPAVFWDLFGAEDTAEKRSLHTRAYGEAEETMRKIRKSDKTISIITGAPHWIAMMEMEKLNGAPVDFYCSTHDKKFPDKPDPASFFFVLAQTNMKPSETLYIGNSSEDAGLAKNAGVDFVYLERKEHDFEMKEYAIATIHSLEELVV